MGSTTDKIAGKANELAGQARQSVGKAIDDKEMQGKGIAQEVKGDAQQAKGKAKDAVKDELAPRHAGVLVWRRRNDPVVGEEGEPEIVYSVGTIGDFN